MTNNSDIMQEWVITQELVTEWTWTDLIKQWVAQEVGWIIEWEEVMYEYVCKSIYQKAYIFWNNNIIQLIITDNYLFILTINNVSVELNDDLYEDEILDKTNKLQAIKEILKTISQEINKWASVCINAELNITRNEELIDTKSLKNILVNTKIKLQYWRKLKDRLRKSQEKDEFLKILSEQIKIALKYYSEEEVEEITEEEYNQFITNLNEVNSLIENIQARNSKITSSIQTIINTYWIK